MRRGNFLKWGLDPSANYNMDGVGDSRQLGMDGGSVICMGWVI